MNDEMMNDMFDLYAEFVSLETDSVSIREINFPEGVRPVLTDTPNKRVINSGVLGVSPNKKHL